MDKKPIKGYRELIPSILKTKREELGITQEQLSELCEVKRETINRIEQGKFLPNLELFLVIIHNLKCEIVIKNKF